MKKKTKKEPKKIIIYTVAKHCPICSSSDVQERSGFNVCFSCGHHF